MENKQMENTAEEIVVELNGCGPNAVTGFAAN